MQLNRSFARRVGKNLSSTKKSFLQHGLSNFLIDADAPLSKSKNYSEVCLEIGFGMGEHLAQQCISNKDCYFIGADPYLNGVANLLVLAKQYEILNLGIWNDDVDIILDNIPPSSLSSIYILFPDPWPKRRHHKRRLINSIRLKKFYNLLKVEGFLVFASDVSSYVSNVVELFKECSGFVLRDLDNDVIPKEETKYHKKARLSGENATFLSYTKNL